MGLCPLSAGADRVPGMKSVHPQVFLVDRPQLDYDAQNLAEFAGKICYRAWEPGLNPNIVRVRNDQDKYLENILASAHGSVLEHVSFSFVLHNVSRVCCYDDDTEVLTTKGWKPWPKVDGTEVFGTLNPATGELEYQEATEFFRADYAGPMYRVHS